MFRLSGHAGILRPGLSNPQPWSGVNDVYRKGGSGDRLDHRHRRGMRTRICPVGRRRHGMRARCGTRPQGRRVDRKCRRQSAVRCGGLRAPGTCERLVDETVARIGGLDILVNNAGILYTANALDTTNEQWLETMAVNVNALFYASRAAVRHMRIAGKGAIVNIASEWGMNGEPNHVAYCASKGAVLQIARCMALDHAA